MAVSVAVLGATDHLPEEISQQVLRVAQEALANAVKHAASQKIRMTLDQAPGEVRLTVEDDGQGFDPQTAFSALGGHFGLLGMRERAERLGGSLRVDSSQGRGTRVELQIPVSSRRAWSSRII